jgi:predicted RNA-binding Zn ribbon-like protein
MLDSSSYQFSRIGGALCLDFVNTASWQGSESTTEHLETSEDLLRWCLENGTGNPETNLPSQAPGTSASGSPLLRKALKLRKTIYGLFLAVADGRTPRQSDIEALNRALAASPACFHIQYRSGRFNCQRKTAGVGSENMLDAIAWSAADLLASDDLSWVKRCASDGCGWLFIDRTKNHRRRWCDMADCGSRAKAHRYYQRKRNQKPG